MASNAPPAILVTGATSGIGLELARIFNARATRLVPVGRKPFSELEDPPYDAAQYCRADLTQEAAADVVAAFLGEHEIDALDLLVHNAGVGFFGEIAAQTDDGVADMLETNLMAPIALTHALLPRLVQARGKVVFVSSVVTALATPDYAVYTATKAALEGFARSLRVELAGRVRVQVVRPGATRTPMHEKSGLPREVADPHKFPSAAEVARKIAVAIEGNARTKTIGTGNKLLGLVGRNLAAPVDGLMRRRAR